MKKTTSIILALLFFTVKIFGQVTLESYVDEGVKLYDAGDYEGAIAKYKKALEIDSKSPLANYEMASTYYALNDYKNAIEHSDAVIDANTKYVDQAYILKGSALDVMGKPKDAVKVYKKGIKEYPDNYLLPFNLGYTLFNLKEYKDAEEALQAALKLKPSHASSHLLLGYVMNEEGNRVKALLAFYNFLLLEPEGKRAKNAYAVLEQLLKRGVSRDGNNTTINISTPKGKDGDEFSAAELMLSLLEASKNLEKNEAKSEPELFADNTKSFFSVLGELKKDNKGFWWNYYVDFYYTMVNKEYSEAFSYYISQSKEDPKVTGWLKNNKDKNDAFLKWFSDFERTY